jgi:hypothetical protein
VVHARHPNYTEGIGRRIKVQGQALGKKHEILSEKNNLKEKGLKIWFKW